VKIAVDVTIGKRGIRLLEAAGHEVVVEAAPGEQDHDWFERALARGVELVIAIDRDLNVLCYEHRVRLFRQKTGHSGKVTAQRLIQRLDHERTRERPR
jgi:hypothetical protein